MIKKTNNEFRSEVYKLVGDEYCVLSKYVSTMTKMALKHNKCGYKWNISPNSFLRGTRCPKCSGNAKKTTQLFIDEVYSLVQDEYSVMGSYVNALTRIPIRHNYCGYEYDVKPDGFIHGRRCPKCYGTKKKTHAEFCGEIYNLVFNEYSILSEYLGANIKILVNHNVCGHRYNVTPSSFLGGKRCPKCSSERKESRLASQLKEYFERNYLAITEYNECINPATGRYLPYDIFIPKYKIYVEIQGRQHYEICTGIYEEKLSEIQRRDKIKKKHARKNGIYIEIDAENYTLKRAVEYIERHI